VAFPRPKGQGRRYSMAFPLMRNHPHLSGQRAQSEKKRVIVLTRSAMPVSSAIRPSRGRATFQGNLGRVSQADPGGPQLLDERIPYWNTDIGGFSAESQRPEIPGAVHALVPVRRLPPHVPRARHRRRQRVLAIRPATQKTLRNFERLRYRLMAVHLLRVSHQNA